MLPTRAVAPTLSRFCDEVWFTWPELHAESVTGAMSRTPMAAARRARFTVVDLQELTRGLRRSEQPGCSVSAPLGAPPGGNPIQPACRTADGEGVVERRTVRTGLPFDDVLAAAQAGAAWAFEVLYRDLAPAVTGYLRLHGAAEPDDLASETFIGVFTGLRKFSGDEDGLRAWVFTI